MAVPREILDTGALNANALEIQADRTRYEHILTPAALAFLTQLHRQFDASR